MLKKIVSISGKPGLFKVISNGKNMLIVESLTDKRRLPVYSSERVIALGDITMYTASEDKPLKEIFLAMKEKENGQKAGIDPKSDVDSLREYLSGIVPDFDKNKVYPSDIKKLIQWYNIFVETGNLDLFEEKDEKSEESVAAK